MPRMPCEPGFQCPMGALIPFACMFCLMGHMTECHYPYDCEQAECSHYQREGEIEDDYEPPYDLGDVP